jgi:hypothetical protein
MKKMRSNGASNGFGLQRDITSEGAVLYLRITNPRRLNSELLFGILKRHFMGGYNVLIVDQGRGRQKKVNFHDFLTSLKNAMEESQLIFLERRLTRDARF